MGLLQLSKSQQALLLISSFLLVAFGQPAWVGWVGLLAAVGGYALFWRVLLEYPIVWHRFIIASLWFTCIQGVQLSWSLSHPYSYIYFVYTTIVLFLGTQFGILAIFIDKAHLRKISSLAAIAALWTLLEWIRLFILSGFSWNPVGLALTGNIIPLQMASLWGVFGLTFWVMLVNLLALQAWCYLPSKKNVVLWAGAALIPYVFGIIHIVGHSNAIAKEESRSFRTLLVQPAFPVEEQWGIVDFKQMVPFVVEEWHQILRIMRKHHGKPVDLIVLPEYVVPFSAYSFVFPYDTVAKAFSEIFGLDSLSALPPKQSPFTHMVEAINGQKEYFVSNAFWAQAIANYFQAGILVGMEDAERKPDGQMYLYSAALYFQPGNKFWPIPRYEKRVLVPMAEYIPFEFCRSFAAAYGINSSFTCGTQARVFEANNVPFGVSICYEETFGNVMRESKLNGALLLTNLTNDGWYPKSRLAQQHFDHSRLRTVENGLPLIRACNTGITGGIDSLGQVVAMLDHEYTQHPEQHEEISDSLFMTIPLYTYQTIYGRFGDWLIIGISLMLVFLFLRLDQ